VYASTSSVYGANTNMPFVGAQQRDNRCRCTPHKRANELMAHNYSALFRLHHRLRFFHVLRTVGRPTWRFPVHAQHPRRQADRCLQPRSPRRDFTYVDDIAEGVVRIASASRSPIPH